VIDPAKVCLWVPEGLKKFKLDLFNAIAAKIERAGGRVVRHDPAGLANLTDDIWPIVGCHPPLKAMVEGWQARGRNFIVWDRGYCRRIFSTWLPRAETGTGYYRWTLNAYQMQSIRDVPDDRWKALRTPAQPWAKGGRHIVVCMPTQPYTALHGTERWTDQTVEALNKLTDRPVVIRSKESKRPLAEDLKGAHALVTHGSNAANEAVILGCPVFVDSSCAAALVGKTDLRQIEAPAYPDRQPWLNSLAYSQFDERELVDGTLWRLIG
jgi:hypothetical protein